MKKQKKKLRRKRSIYLIRIAALLSLAIFVVLIANHRKSTDIQLIEAIPENDVVIARFDVIDETGSGNDWNSSDESEPLSVMTAPVEFPGDEMRMEKRMYDTDDSGDSNADISIEQLIQTEGLVST